MIFYTTFLGTWPIFPILLDKKAKIHHVEEFKCIRNISEEHNCHKMRRNYDKNKMFSRKIHPRQQCLPSIWSSRKVSNHYGNQAHQKPNKVYRKLRIDKNCREWQTWRDGDVHLIYIPTQTWIEIQTPLGGWTSPRGQRGPGEKTVPLSLGKKPWAK